MTGPLRAEPLVEQAPSGRVRHEVEVTLTDVQWRQLVGDIAARVRYLESQRAPIIATLLAAGELPGNPQQQDMLTEAVNMLAGPTYRVSEYTLPPTFTLTPDDAIDLAESLADASDPPAECACGRIVHRPSSLTTECESCADRRNMRASR